MIEGLLLVAAALLLIAVVELHLFRTLVHRVLWANLVLKTGSLQVEVINRDLAGDLANIKLIRESVQRIEGAVEALEKRLP